MSYYSYMNCNGDVFHKELRLKETDTRKWPRQLERPKPPCGYYHYSNDASQGSLICETPGFPGGYDPSTQDYHAAYSDRLSSWDRKRFEKLCEMARGGDQGWGSRLQNMTEDRLREFARVAFDLATPPAHVRVVHYFNVSNGYSCPTIEAICDKIQSAAAPSE